MSTVFVQIPSIIVSLLMATVLFSCNSDKKLQDKLTDKITDSEKLYFKATDQSKFDAKIAENIPARLVGSWDGVCSKAFRLEDGLKPTSVKEIHEIYPDRDSKSFIIFYLGEDCKKGNEVFALTVDIERQSYLENAEENNISVSANIEDLSFEILNIPGNQSQKDLILQMFNQKELCQISDWKVSQKRSIAGAQCMGMKIPEKGLFYLNNYWILKQNMKAMLSLNPIHKDEVKLIEENQLFDQKPFSFLRKTKERTDTKVPKLPNPNKDTKPEPELKLSGIYKSSCVRDNFIDLYKRISLNRITTIDFDNRTRTDKYYLPSSEADRDSLVLDEDSYECSASAKLIEVKTGLLASLDGESLILSYNLNSNVKSIMDTNRALSYKVPVDSRNIIDIPVWSEKDSEVYSCAKRAQWKQCTKRWLRSGNYCQKTCAYSSTSKENKIYLPLNYLLSQNKICGIGDWSKGPKSVGLSSCKGLSFRKDLFVVKANGSNIESLSDETATYEPKTSSPKDPENKAPAFSANWQTSETKNINGIDVKTTIDLKLKTIEKGFFSYTPILGLASISNRITFESFEVQSTDKIENSMKVWQMNYSVSEAVGYIKNSDANFNKLLLQNYSKVCKNVANVEINKNFNLSGASCEGFYIPEPGQRHEVEFYINPKGKLVLFLTNKDIYFVKK